MGCWFESSPGHQPAAVRCYNECYNSAVANRVTLRRIGSSTGVILPKAELARLQVEAGDELFLVETPTGIELTPYDPEFEAQLASARKLMKKYRNTLRELAK